MSPGAAADSAELRVDGVTGLVTAPAAATGMGRVVAVVVVGDEPPSGSARVSSTSEGLPASRSKRLPLCLLPHWPFPEPNVPESLLPAGTRMSGSPVFHAVAPDSR